MKNRATEPAAAARTALPRLSIRTTVLAVSLFALALTAGPASAQHADVRLTEFLAVNDSGLTDEDADFSDWIEVHNAGNAPVNLIDWALTDDPEHSDVWRFPSVELEAGDYLVIFASSKNRANAGAELHTDFKLTKGGEYLALLAPDATVVTAFAPSYPAQSADVSYGGSGEFFDTPSPGAQNPQAALAQISFDPPGRAFAGAVSVQLEGVDGRDGTIRYTTNGSQPTSSSTAYSGPISITSTQTIRAAMFDGGERGAIAETSYLALSSGPAAFASSLPIVIVDTDGGTPSSSAAIDARITVIDRTGGQAATIDPADYSGVTTIKVRGSSSAGFAKRQYKIELQDSDGENNPADLLDLGAEQDWILYAPGLFDRSLIANPLMQDLAAQVGLASMTFRPVEMYLNTGNTITNNDYVGIYYLAESIKIDDDRVDINKLDPGDNAEPEISGGYLLSMDRVDTGQLQINVPSNPRPTQSSDFNVVDPKAVELTSAQESWIDDWLDDLDRVMFGGGYQNPNTGYRAYLNTRSMVDSHILRLVAMDPDILRLSSYFSLDRGGKLEHGPIWDFDRTLNSADSRDNNPARLWVSGNGEVHPFEFSWWGRMFDDPAMQWEYVGRWAELRDGPLSNAAIKSTIDSHAAEVAPAYSRENAKWGGRSEYGSRYGTFQGEIDALKSWVDQRLAFLDSYIYNQLPTGSNQRPDVSNPGSQSGWVGDTIALQIDGSDPQYQTVTFTANGLPSGLSIDSATGLISGTLGQAGSFSATVTVSDPLGETRSTSIDWSVDERPLAPIGLNEWNAVGSSDLLPGGDVYFGNVAGNGGDWFELVVIEDHLDLRGWRLQLTESSGGERVVRDILVFDNDSLLSDLRSGTIITVSEDEPDDVSFDPQNGDWWINFQANNADDGAYFGSANQANFDTSADDWQLQIIDSAGNRRFGPAGEGVGSLLSGLNSMEVGELEQDPDANLNVVAAYDDGDDSTFGAPNTFGEGAQDFTALRAWFDPNIAPVLDPIADRSSPLRSTVDFAVVATDGDDDVLTYSATGLPTGLSIDPLTGVVSGVPTIFGAYSVSISVSDGPETVSRSFGWLIDADEVTVSVECPGGPAAVSVDLVNTSGAFATYVVEIDGGTEQRSISATLEARFEALVELDGVVPVVVTRNGVVVFDDIVDVDCDNAPTPTPSPTPVPMPDGVEVRHVVSCLAGNGRIDTNIVNPNEVTATYRIEFEGLSPRQSDVLGGDWWRMPITGRADRSYDVVVKRDGVVVSDTAVTVACDSTPPQVGSTEVQVVNACRVGRGYILFQFVNPGAASKPYIIEFEGVANRSTSAAGYGATVRSVTGRPNGDYDVLIRTGQQPVASLTVTVDCN